MNRTTVTRLLFCGVLSVSAIPFITVTAAPPPPVQLPEPPGASNKLPPHPEHFHGHWVNQRGSSLDLKEHDGLLSGYFTTAVGKTRSCVGTPVSISGVTNINAMSISLSMASCGSPAVISISGVIMKDKDGKEKLKTQALIQFNGKESWDSQILTTDFYTRQEPDKKVDKITKP